MLSCFSFSYSPLKDDDYAQFIIGQHENALEEHANDNHCLDIDCSSHVVQQKVSNSVNCAESVPQSPSSVVSSVSSVQHCSDQSNHKNIKLRTFRKPDSILSVDSCHTVSPVNSNNQNNSQSKSGLLRLGFHKTKGTEHLQRETIRKSNESSQLHSQRYIKLPSAVSKSSESNQNKRTAVTNSGHTKQTNSCHKSSESPTKVAPKPPISTRLSSTVNNSNPQLTRKPPPRPLTSHPGIAAATTKSDNTGKASINNIMPRHNVHKVQFASELTLNESNTVSTNNATGDTSLSCAQTAAAITNITSRNNNNSNVASPTASSSTSLPSLTSSTIANEWSRTSTFINKPPRGWLHPDHKIADTGIAYSVRYIGCIGINTSMKSLDFDTRSQIAKECINRVCEAGGLKTADKKRRSEKRINRMLTDNPNMDNAGANVNLTITSSYLNLSVMETGEMIAKHEMPNISFASGGDTDTLDFVAYVAKDQRYGRACFVLECGGGLAQDVITTIGQAFELRFKQFLKRTPRSTTVNERLENIHHNGANKDDNDNKLEDREYYNDLPGKMPPDVPIFDVHNNNNNVTKDNSALQRITPQAAPRNCLKKSLHSTDQSSTDPNLIDLNTDIQENCAESASNETPVMETSKSEHEYVNCNSGDVQSSDTRLANCSNSAVKDPFDMQPFNNALAEVASDPSEPSSSSTSTNNSNEQLQSEEWFHGPISRKESEALVVGDGDFLVRESQGSAGQYVLTGMQSGIRKHLLLVDPEGVVRTKDKTFESVSHLINYHRNNGLPIISAESALVLRNAILVKR